METKTAETRKDDYGVSIPSDLVIFVLLERIKNEVRNLSNLYGYKLEDEQSEQLNTAADMLDGVQEWLLLERFLDKDRKPDDELIYTATVRIFKETGEEEEDSE